MDTEQATSEKFRKLIQNKRGRLRVKAFADAVDMLSEICREHRWYGSVIRYDGECHAIRDGVRGSKARLNWPSLWPKRASDIRPIKLSANGSRAQV